MSFAPPPPPPPPPPPRPTSFQAAPEKKEETNKLPKPHESSASIPTLESAPPSANVPSGLLAPLPPPPPPPPVRKPAHASSSGSLRSTSASPFMYAAAPPPISMPLPPPPLPSQNSLPQAPVTVATMTGAQPSVAPLPPPPIMRPRSNSSMSAGLQSTGSVSVGHGSVEGTEAVYSSVSGFADAPPEKSASSMPFALPINTFAPSKLQLLARRQTHIPIVIVSTEAANRMAWKNELQIQDMFQGLFHDSRPPSLPLFRTINRSFSVNPSQVHVQFLGGADAMAPYSPDAAHEMLQENALLKDADGDLNRELVMLEDRIDELLQDEPTPNRIDANRFNGKDDLERVTKDAFALTSPLDIPWLLRYRHALDESTNYLPFDMVNCPALILYVCTTNELTSPEECLHDLASTSHYLPQAFTNGVYNPNTMRQNFLVMHDNVDGPQDWDENMLRQSLLRQFGQSGALVRINSVLPSTASALAAQETSDLWHGNGKKGNCLSNNDRVGLRQYFHHLLTNCILPAMERRISELNVIVSERKKGVRNVLKSFWRRPKDEQDTPPVSSVGGTPSENWHGGPIKYRHESIESQTRLLADTLFLMKDYENALGIYRLIRDDYKSDKALAYYANIQEMIGLCMYQTDPYGRAREIFSQFETALFSYNRAAEEERQAFAQNKAQAEQGSRPPEAPPSTRLATRLCLIMLTTRKLTIGRELEVADLLASASSHEAPLGAAVLLEQSSAYYYQAEMYRKYAFHMLMSGHMFRSAEQENHAFRCFTSALYIYRHGRWDELHGHLRSALAAQLYAMGRMTVALQLYAKLVGTTGGGKVSKKSQQKFVSHLLEICKDHPKKALAASDRMAAPSMLTGAARESVRKSQLERIVQVIRFTKGASRILELPHMNLPRINDKSVRIWTNSDGDKEFDRSNESGTEVASAFGDPGHGDSVVWEDLMLASIAESKAMDPSVVLPSEAETSVIDEIEDIDTRKVIAHVKKERTNKTLADRAKRSKNYKPSLTKRSRKEPIFVDFAMSNPLGIDIDISDLQIVARATHATKVCTNQDSIKIASKSASTGKSWKFSGTDMEFESADFCRISGSTKESSERATWKSVEDVSGPPFYVVTKKSIVLTADSENSVTLGICPLVEGELEILGVRCKLFNSIWVFHSFNAAALFPDENPAISKLTSNKEQERSIRFKSQIEADMPCLTADLLPNVTSNKVYGDHILLDGQISSYFIRLTNVGNAPATNVTLKVNSPWINLQPENIVHAPSESLDPEAQPISMSIGPTGTLVNLPLGDSSQIAAGATVDVPVQIRVSGLGKQSLYTLYRYELASDETSTPPHRWLKNMYTIPVYPSLTLSASLRTLSYDKPEYILSLEASNNRTDQPTDLSIFLNEIKILSRNYRLEPIECQFDDSEIKDGSFDLGWQEKISVHYRVVTNKAEGSPCVLSRTTFSNASPTESLAKDFLNSSTINFLCLEGSNARYQSAWESNLMRAGESGDGDAQPRSISQIRRAKGSASDAKVGSDGKASHPTSVSRLCPESDALSKIHLVCAWSVSSTENEGPAFHGEHYLRNLTVRPTSKSRHCPLTATPVYPRLISNNFQNGPISVPVKISLRNHLVDTTTEFDVEIEPSSSYEVTGIENRRLCLKGGEETTIPIDVLVLRSGVYNLQMLKIVFKNGWSNASTTFYRFPQQWLMTVAEAK